MNRDNPSEPVKPQPQLPDEVRLEVEALLFKGEKIEAIKRYRQAVGGGLADAKSEVERLEYALRATVPSQFTAKPRRAGCLGVLVFGGLVGAGLMIRWGMG